MTLEDICNPHLLLQMSLKASLMHFKPLRLNLWPWIMYLLLLYVCMPIPLKRGHINCSRSPQIFFDEMNASSCPGLFKEIIVDKTFHGEVRVL